MSVGQKKMMIDKKDGSVIPPGTKWCISPSLSRSDFLASPMAEGASICIKNEPWCSWDLCQAVVPDGRWYLRLFFYGEKLTTVELSFADANEERSWSDWSKEKELARKRRHDQVLSQTLETQPYLFSWGRVNSNFDERSGSSSIVISYEK